MIRRILTYAGETRAEVQVTKQNIKAIEIRILRNILGTTLRDQRRNVDLKQMTNRRFSEMDKEDVATNR